MRLLVLGPTTEEETDFLKHAVETGYSVVIITPTEHSFSSALPITIRLKPVLTEESLSRALSRTDVVIVTSDCAQRHGFLHILTKLMSQQSLRRLLIVSDIPSREALTKSLNATDIDWTIIYADKTKARPTRQFAAQVVSQITDASYLRSILTLTA